MSLPPIDGHILYAQNMATMAMVQAQQWEMFAIKMNAMLVQEKAKVATPSVRISHVKLHADNGKVVVQLVQQKSDSQCCNGELKICGIPASEALTQEIQKAVAKAREEGRNTNEVLAEITAAIQEAMKAKRVAVAAENLRRQKALLIRLGCILKMVILLVVFDASITAMVVFLFGVVLYLYGCFDPLVTYFTNNRPSLENTLNKLRDPEREEVKDETEEKPVPPSRFVRAFYQSFVMFFGSLMPWWKPDPRYIA